MDLYQVNERFKDLDKNESFFSKLQEVAGELGFKYCAYGVRPVFSGKASLPKIINNYPESWNLTYVRNNYFTIDPAVQHGLRSSQALVWDEQLFREVPLFWEEANIFGIKSGISQSYKDESGRIGMLTFAGDNADYYVQAPALTWLSQIACIRLADDLIPSNKVIKELTKRERDILCWTAEGKTTEEIAILLSIKNATVNFHINNILTKLSVPNKAAATAKAVLLNLISY